MSGKYIVFEFDFVKMGRLDTVGEFDDLEQARDKAKEVASKWCEGERVELIGKGSAYEEYGGESDFGTIILLSRNPEKLTDFEQNMMLDIHKAYRILREHDHTIPTANVRVHS